MKGAALESARVSASIGADFMTRRILKPIKIEYDPPAASRALYPGSRKSAACVSIDFDVTVEDRFEPNRAGTKALLSLSEEYGVPLTWAICGMTADADKESYGRILDASTRQELGIHTYSHIDAKKCDADQFESDVTRCVESLELKTPPTTFIFPWNRVNHFPVLRKLGFKVYRGKERAVSAPTPSEGLFNIRTVYYVDQKSFGAQSLMNKYVDLCAGASSVFHLWTHPWSMVMRDGNGPMTDTLKPVFSHLQKMSDAGEIALCTMGELAEHFQSAGPTKKDA